MTKLAKVNFSISTNMRNDGTIDTTSIIPKTIAEEITSKLEEGDKYMHLEVLKYLYNIGYLKARASILYDCDIAGNYKED